MEPDRDIARLAETLVAEARKAHVRLATAESCTGGLVCAAITSIAGSSSVLDRGFVTYSNEAKIEMLGVPAELIQSNGAVSAEVAIAMADGAVRMSGANIAVSITGVAGPGGGSETKPVGLVHFGLAFRGRSHHRSERFGSDLDRHSIRRLSVATALRLLLDGLRTNLS